MNLIVLTGLILGITSNLHCIGMCGPIALAIPVDRKSNLSIFRDSFFYNAGRIATYTLMGSLVGSIGLSVNSIGALQWLSIVAGILLIVFAWRKTLSRWLPLVHIDLGLHMFFSRSMGKLLKSGSLFKLPLLGMLNGLLPCGMVFLALGNAILGGDFLSSALAMLAFGIGTLPGMMLVTIMSNKLSPKIRMNLVKIVPVILSLVGALIVVRGMNLGIPYISPKLEIAKDRSMHESSSEVTMSCCQNKENCH